MDFKPLSRTEEILYSILTGDPYTEPALSRKEELLIRLKEAFDNWFS